MSLKKDKIIFVSLMLFSMFFGAGNLIFPPFLGQNAADSTVSAFIGFLITSVVLPVLGILVTVKFGGLENLSGKVNGKFALVFSVLLYLAIGPGLAIPRAASVPFEMAIAPYLSEGTSFAAMMLLYSFVFFAASAWLSYNPSKLVERMGTYLTPVLIFLLVFLFGAFVFAGDKSVISAQNGYEAGAFVKGFVEGYNTMDTLAALVFGIVVVNSFVSLGVNDKKEAIRYTYTSGLISGGILAVIYLMLTYMGMQSSGIYPVKDNGAWTLRNIVYQLFGNFGAILLAVIFTLACITTCVGLITSVSEFFSSLTKGKISYKKMVTAVTIFSFVVCNQGLTVILSISVPVLNAIYPTTIVLILLGLFYDFYKDNKLVFPLTVSGTAIISIIYAFLGLEQQLSFIPLYKIGFGWVSVALVLFIASLILGKIKSK